MRIVIFDGSFKTTAFIRRLMQGLTRAGHQVYVLGFNLDNPAPMKGVHYISLGNNSSNFHFIRTSLKWGLRFGEIVYALKNLFLVKKSKLRRLNLRAALKAIDPHIVHLQWISTIPLFEDELVEGKYKFVISQRGYQTNVRPFVSESDFEYQAKWLPYFSGFHSVSKTMSSQGDKIFNTSSKVNQVAYTGLDLSQIEFSSNVVENSVLDIISIGRPHWKKGYVFAIRALHKIKMNGIEFKYTIIGAENDQELLFLIKDLDLENEIELFPKLDQKEVFKKIQDSELFLLPSLEEGIANVAVEAMALGTPVISTDCGGMKELIESGKEGWIVPVYDINAMAETVTAFAKASPEKIAQIKLAARRKVEHQHNEEKMVTDMNTLYQKIYNGLD
ncbi:colanic acid biosynthesis protein [Nonlabens spongiae]|uniref:Colanic acid biosynthesis protein n=1 Tax=Nonlabens spongiae TaxID=331648 RepID=A0A1W6MNW4_9FLAO|nr:glycosyltransferase family 4 protein [Nonlabens spongiae]ARN79298.1 colanic acid biosynthesis protein [Nonlabens spongiae]